MFKNKKPVFTTYNCLNSGEYLGHVLKVIIYNMAYKANRRKKKLAVNRRHVLCGARAAYFRAATISKIRSTTSSMVITEESM